MGFTDGTMKASVTRNKKNPDHMDIEVQMPPGPKFEIPKMEVRTFSSKEAAKIDRIIHRLRDALQGEPVGDAGRALETVVGDVQSQAYGNVGFLMPAPAKRKRGA